MKSKRFLIFKMGKIAANLYAVMIRREGKTVDSEERGMHTWNQSLEYVREHGNWSTIESLA